MTANLEEALAGLRREYLTESPGRLADLRKDVAAFRAGEPDAVSSLIQRFHRLSGSGGSYGFPAVSEISKRMELWLKNEAPTASAEHSARLEGAVKELSAAFDQAAVDLGLSESSAVVTEFGWRGLVIGQPGRLRDEIGNILQTSGFLVRTESGTGEPRTSQLTEQPDLLVIIAEPDKSDSYATATAWSGAGVGRPRAIVLVDPTDSTDQVRALAAGIDVIFGADRASVELSKYAKTLARIGSPPPRVLLVEEDANEAQLIISWLEQANAKVTHCRDGITARELLARETPDLLLMDTRLPGLDGLSLARLIRQDQRFALTPIVFLTAQDTVSTQIEALRAGADHFLIEPVDRDLLAHLVINRAERGRRIREMVHRDGLTGLLNHATLMAELEHAIEYARRHGETFAFMMIDVDHFKRVNDKYGHLVGDQVLLHLARIFQTTARASDLIGRYGGEEFGMILRRTDQQGAGVLAGKLRQGLAESPATIAGAEAIAVKVCIGVACYPVDGINSAELADTADQALYRAKGAGRDQVAFAGSQTV